MSRRLVSTAPAGESKNVILHFEVSAQLAPTSDKKKRRLSALALTYDDSRAKRQRSGIASEPRHPELGESDASKLHSTGREQLSAQQRANVTHRPRRQLRQMYLLIDRNFNEMCNGKPAKLWVLRAGPGIFPSNQYIKDFIDLQCRLSASYVGFSAPEQIKQAGVKFKRQLAVSRDYGKVAKTMLSTVTGLEKEMARRDDRQSVARLRSKKFKSKPTSTAIAANNRLLDDVDTTQTQVHLPIAEVSTATEETGRTMITRLFRLWMEKLWRVQV
ncbi:hypothetical protein ANO11243_072810 [Dothideomycetidae sp. 11243]|nr:hypothetical protein ANO11243_072810 [fungal sp. No.11243]